LRFKKNYMTGFFVFALFVFILNIPFGYWRGGTRKFSRDWYLAIHIPVPVIVGMRIYFDLGWSWESYIYLITAFFLGQLTGKLIRKYQ
jgi:hypothetical protein